MTGPLPADLYLRQRRLGLRQPEGHVHGAVHTDGGGQGYTGPLTTTGLAVQPAQPVVAVGYERAHAECLCQGQGLLVMGFGLRDIGRIGVGMDNTKLVQRVHLVPTFLVLPGLLAVSRQTTDFAEPCDPFGKT